MDIKQYIWDVVDSNSWLMIEKNRGILIDAVDDTKLYEEIMELDELMIILTHAHFDHIIGLNKIRSLKPDTVVISTEKCSQYLENIHRNMSSVANIFIKLYNNGINSQTEIKPFTCDEADKTFGQNMHFNWCDHDIKLDSYKGHSDDGLIVIVDNRCMFSGDTLLSIPTITRFPSGSTKRFWEEDIPRLKNIEVDVVYPGHGKAGMIEDMLKENKQKY